MTAEKWMPIPVYGGIYEVSDTGLVRSVDRYVDLPGEKRRRIRGKQLSPKRSKDGYLFVSLSKDGVAKTHYIHRLVATAYIPNPNGLPEVNHLDGIKTNNAVINLDWCTHRDNVRHAYANGLNLNVGENHPFAVEVIDNELGQTFGTVQDWCAARGIKYSTGRNLLNNQGRSRTIDLTQVTKVSKTNND
ncbi:MAG: NUMOD4 motif-containing HNH endonuclease [Flavipsychrobacter sp.]|nr:NUMOD4 motif-containing HNH endonuclease [Flavipsychrobacter sp.]